MYNEPAVLAKSSTVIARGIETVSPERRRSEDYEWRARPEGRARNNNMVV